jgi:drug/metabolite transporter, DME family
VSRATRARIQIMLGALLFSTGGVAIKASTFSGWQVSGFRSLIAALVLIVCLKQARRGVTWRSFVVALPYAATFVLYALANKATTAANAIFLQDTAPLYLLLLGPLALGEPVRRSDALLMCALAVGLALIFLGSSAPLATAPAPGFGNGLAAASGVSWALTILGLRWLAVRGVTSGEHPATAVVAGSLLAALVSGLFAFPVSAPTFANWSVVIYLGVFQIALPYVLITDGVREVGALESSLLLLIEPVFAPLWAWLVLAETPAGLALLGGALILAAAVTHTASVRRPAITASQPTVEPPAAGP